MNAAQLFIYAATAGFNLGYSRIEARQRLFLYPERRHDDRFAASLAATFRSLKIGTFARSARARYETNRSDIEIYDFDRIAAEVGITAAF